MRFFKNKLVLGIICILIGLAVGFVAMPKATDKLNEQIDAVKATKFIEQGAEITSDMIDTLNVDKSITGEGVISADSIIGKYAITNIYSNDFITSYKISEILGSDDLLAIATQKGLRVVSITLPSLASSVSGRLKAGDIVTLITTDKNNNLNMMLEAGDDTYTKENMTSYIIEELKYLEVAMLITSDASDASVIANPTDDEKNRLPVTISFFVTEKQAILLAEIEKESEIHIVFVARGSNAAGYIPTESRVLNTENINIVTEGQSRVLNTENIDIATEEKK